MNERKFCPLINNSFRALGAFSYKIPDMPNLGGKIRFQKKKPLDGFTMLNGDAFGWEAKYSKGIKGLGYNVLQEHQKENLETIINNGFEGYVFYCCYEARTLKIMFVICYDFLKEKKLISKKELLEYLKKGQYLSFKTRTCEINGKEKKSVIFDANNFYKIIIGGKEKECLKKLE